MEEKLKVLNHTEKWLEKEIEKYQKEYNYLISSLSNVSDNLTQLEMQNISYNNMKKKVSIKKNNMLKINIICILLFLIKFPLIIIISSIFIILNTGINLIQINKVKSQINKINIVELKNEIKKNEQIIEDKKREIKYSYMQIDDMHKILIDIKNKKRDCTSQIKKIENEELEIIEEKEKQYVER